MTSLLNLFIYLLEHVSSAPFMSVFLGLFIVVTLLAWVDYKL